MRSYAELEVRLNLHTSDNAARYYDVEFRLNQPGNDADRRLIRSSQPVADADFARWRELQTDESAYGKLLNERFLSDVELQAFLAEARGAAGALCVPLCMRLEIGPRAPELAGLRWETLLDPATGAPLATSENIVFSRYIASRDSRPVALLAKAELRALLFIASPANLAQKSLPAIDVAAEMQRARAALGEIKVVDLPTGSRATISNLIAHLRRGIDILYLVCHGALADGEPWLWLENDDGNAQRVRGEDLVSGIRDMRQPPQLVLLASCQSGDPGTLVAIGPRLAAAGVPAVLAMQGKVSQETAFKFFSVFFAELNHDGRIDSAAATARGHVRDRDDWWAPVLFMRLRSGRIWYVPGFGERAPVKWRALADKIREGQCTPILGPGLCDSLVGSYREVAQKLARTYAFPFYPHDREDLFQIDLPQIAQFLSADQGPEFMPRGILQQLVEELGRNGEIVLPEELRTVPPSQQSREQLLNTFELTLKHVWQRRCSENQAEPHHVLARLPFRLYVTAKQDNLLATALEAVGKSPEVEVSRWTEELVALSSIEERDPGYQPDPHHRPLVYHLFGRLGWPPGSAAKSLSYLVLSEDNYFDFLIGTAKNNSLIPAKVRRCLSDTALLFLGFRFDEWSFRVLFRSIVNLEGRRRRQGFRHIAVQIDPEDGHVQDPERARRYLESYFRFADLDIDIYWGTVEDFMTELYAQSDLRALLV
ncbi:MAG: CHAT domain-containing protein [Acidobacteriota bacterium]|nr:CHAT domain-containing protein [Acidobacteriota bacterium]